MTTTPAGKRRIVRSQNGDTAYYLTAADMLAFEPRALFSERRVMERMGPYRLAFHIAFRTLFGEVESRLSGRALRAWWIVWRQYAKTWPKV